MRQLFYKIGSVLMALVVVFSIMSFTINSHFCGDTLVSTSYFSEAKTCGMEMKQDTNIKKCSISKKNCCKDVIQLIEGLDNLKKSEFDSLSYDQQLFLTTFFYTCINLFEGLHNNVIPFKGYAPPLVVKDIQVLDEVYLI